MIDLQHDVPSVTIFFGAYRDIVHHRLINGSNDHFQLNSTNPVKKMENKNE